MKELEDGRPAFVLVHARRRTITHRHNAESDLDTLAQITSLQREPGKVLL